MVLGSAPFYLATCCQSEKEEMRDIFHQPVCFLNGYNSQSWTGLKSGASNSFWVSHVDNMGSGARAFIAYLPRYISRIRSREAKIRTSASVWDAAHSNGLTHCVTTLVPISCLIFRFQMDFFLGSGVDEKQSLRGLTKQLDT